MCGRIGLTELSWRQLVAVLRAELAPEHEQLFRPRYNLAPTQDAWICREVADRRQLIPARWGFPSHAAHNIINARAETAATAKSFKQAFLDRRCVIPVSGFFEWTRDGRHQPYWFTASDDGAPLLLAGLYREGTYGLNFVIITTAANDAIRPIHHRMPAVLSVDAAEAWLERADETLLKRAPEGALRFHAVSRKVNTAGFEGPECIAPKANGGGPVQLGLKLS
jgi:putative SOS response-associated peptidase YedK